MKGFFASAILLSALFLISTELAVYELSCSKTQEVKNTILLRQQINERIYEVEDGFKFVAREALHNAVGTENEKKAMICTKIWAWAKVLESKNITSAIGLWNVSFSAFPLDGNELKEPYFGFNFGNCAALLEIKNNELWIKKIGIKTAFVFQTNVHQTNVTILIPEGTVIT